MGPDPLHVCRGRKRQVARNHSCSNRKLTLRIPVTDISDLELVDRLSNGKVDLTFGSSLDIFGGKTVKFDELVALSHEMAA